MKCHRCPNDANTSDSNVKSYSDATSQVDIWQRGRICCAKRQASGKIYSVVLSILRLCMYTDINVAQLEAKSQIIVYPEFMNGFVCLYSHAVELNEKP